MNRDHCHEFKAVIQTFEEMLMNHLVRDIWSGTPKSVRIQEIPSLARQPKQG